MSKELNIDHRGIQDTQTILRNYLSNVIKCGDIVVDATAGKGRDTLFLAECVGSEGRVYAFDIQNEAIRATRELLINHGKLDRVQLLHESHIEIARFVPKGIRAVLFNLGYLPGSDHLVTTKPDTTVRSIQEALNLLSYKGIIAITVYRGHEGGLEESKTILEYVSMISRKDFSVLQGIYLNQGELSPYWIMIQKNREDNG